MHFCVNLSAVIAGLDIAEVSGSSYLAAHDNNLPFRAVPVFLHRRFRHGFMSHEMTHAKPDDKRAEFITDEAIKNKQIDPTLSIPLDRLDWMQNLFLKAGVIKQTVPIESIIDKSVNADAAKIAGK